MTAPLLLAGNAVLAIAHHSFQVGSSSDGQTVGGPDGVEQVGDRPNYRQFGDGVDPAHAQDFVDLAEDFDVFNGGTVGEDGVDTAHCGAVVNAAVGCWVVVEVGNVLEGDQSASGVSFAEEVDLVDAEGTFAIVEEFDFPGVSSFSRSGGDLRGSLRHGCASKGGLFDLTKLNEIGSAIAHVGGRSICGRWGWGKRGVLSANASPLRVGGAQLFYQFGLFHFAVSANLALFGHLLQLCGGELG